MTLEQLMAFSVSDDHERQEQVWELLAHSYNRSGAYIRQKLTENSVRVADKRVRFVGVEAYVEAGGGVMRDLFEEDDRSEEHTSELPSLMRISYAVFCLKQNTQQSTTK